MHRIMLLDVAHIRGLSSIVLGVNAYSKFVGIPQSLTPLILLARFESAFAQASQFFVHSSPMYLVNMSFSALYV